MKRLEVKDRARLDLRDLSLYIARDNPDRAASFIEELLARMTVVAERPQTFREREEWGSGIRSDIYHRYHIVFRDEGEIVTVLRVLHGAQDLPAVLDE